MKRLRFSLKLFLILLTAFCLWMGKNSIDVRRQKEAVEWVLKNGGTVKYDWEYYRSKPPSAQWLRKWLGTDYFDEVVYINLTSTSLTDISPLSDLRDLKVVWLPGNAIEDITPLGELTELEEIYLFVNRVKDISALGQLKRLRVFSAERNHIEDATPLLGLSSLELVDLTRNEISDRELMAIAERFPEARVPLRVTPEESATR